MTANSTYRLKAAGFKSAPKLELFVAPMWTPGREDFLLELCGEIDDEDTTLVDRAEERSERFSEYSDKRTDDAARAHKAVEAITEHIPLGQPILIGHHSERRARKDAERIQTGMRRAVKLWETSTYWTERAAGALRHAKYKELPAVRARRIKGLKADKRKQERYLSEAITNQKAWAACEAIEDTETQKAAALKLASNGASFRLARKEGDKTGLELHTQRVLRFNELVFIPLCPAHAGTDIRRSPSRLSSGHHPRGALDSALHQPPHL